jgi:hypothetical protein
VADPTDGPPPRAPTSFFSRLRRVAPAAVPEAPAAPPPPVPPEDFEARLTAMAAEITAAYVAGNKTPVGDIPDIFRIVRAGLAELREPVEEAEAEPVFTPPTPPAEAVEGAAPVVVPEIAPAPIAARPPAARPLLPAWLMLDRAAVLLIGVAVGAMIGYAFLSQNLPPPAKTPVTVAAAAPPAQISATLDCPIPFTPHLLQDISAGQPITVGVFGDSFGDGVWAALYHLLPKNYHVLRFSKESTGFTRYASDNLEDKEHDQLSGQPVDIAVIDFGANDTQGIYDGGHAFALLSDGWRRVYGARMDRFVSVLREQGAMVYWVGLPIMRKPEYDSQISDMLAFYDQRMTALGVPYIDVRKLSEDSSGAFNDYLPTPGSQDPKLMRANDGIHMTMAGYERIAAPVAARIQDYVTRAKATLAIDAPATPAVSAAAAPGAPTS